MTKRWDEHRSAIISYYKEQHRPLKDVKRLMAEHYGFTASTRAYRSRLDRWGVYKYNCRRPRGSASGSPQDRSPRTTDDDDEGYLPSFTMQTEGSQDQDFHPLTGTRSPPASQGDQTMPLAAQAAQYRYFPQSPSPTVIYTGQGGKAATLAPLSPHSADSVGSGSTMSRNSSTTQPATAFHDHRDRQARSGMGYATSLAEGGRYSPFEAYQQHQFQQPYQGDHRYHVQHLGSGEATGGTAQPHEIAKEEDHEGVQRYIWSGPSGYHDATHAKPRRE